MQQSICTAWVACVLMGLSSPVQAQYLAPNRALYVFEPLRLNQNGDTMPLDGRVAYELTGNECLGYEIDSRVANVYATISGQKRVDLQAATFEAGDSKKFNASQTEFLNQKSVGEEHISVTRDAGGAGIGKISGGKKIDFKLRPEVLFPAAYQKKLIALGLKGEKYDTSLVYDGSDADKIYRAIAIIGQKQAPGSNATDKANPVAAPLLNMNAWQYSIGYYPAADDKAEQPDYQTDFTMYENGVTSSMSIDYGAYVLKGKLTQLEMLPSHPCSPGTQEKVGTPP